MFTIPSYSSHTLYNSLHFVLICNLFYHLRSMKQINSNWKRVIVAFAIVITIIGLHSSFRFQTAVSNDKPANMKMVSNKKITHVESRTTSASLEFSSCRSNIIVVRPESITLKIPTELTKVVPLWSNTRADKCIGNIKAKPMTKFASNKNQSFNRCVKRNQKVHAIQGNSFRRMHYSITHSYFKELKKKQ